MTKLLHIFPVGKFSLEFEEDTKNLNKYTPKKSNLNKYGITEYKINNEAI
jgi:hypothetical protein